MALPSHRGESCTGDELGPQQGRLRPDTQAFPGTRSESLRVACTKGYGISFLGAFLHRGRGMEEMTWEGLPGPCRCGHAAELLAGEAAAETHQDG